MDGSPIYCTEVTFGCYMELSWKLLHSDERYMGWYTTIFWFWNVDGHEILLFISHVKLNQILRFLWFRIEFNGMHISIQYMAFQFLLSVLSIDVLNIPELWILHWISVTGGNVSQVSHGVSQLPNFLHYLIEKLEN